MTDFFDGRTFIPKRAGDEILKMMRIKTIEGSEEMYYYHQTGHYVPGAEERLKEVIADLLEEDFTAARCKELLEYITTQTFTKAPTGNRLNLLNGILNLDDMKFYEHSPDYFDIKQVPIIFDQEARCDVWLRALSEKLEPEDVETLQEIFGYTLMPGQRYEKAVLFCGPRRTMKSTILSVLRDMLGHENVTSYSLQRLNEDPRALAYLFGKAANIHADLTTAALRDVGAFMLITGQDSVTADKKYRDPFTFLIDAKLIFSCNEIPPTYNKNLAFYRRWIIIMFTKQHEKADPFMRDKLTAELPGILNWSIAGFKRLQDKGFTHSMPDEEIKDLYERNSDTVQSFISNCVDTEDDEATTTKRQVRLTYEQYCQTNGLRCVNHIAFGRQFRELTGCGTCKKDRLPAYSGIKLGGEGQVS